MRDFIKTKRKFLLTSITSIILFAFLLGFALRYTLFCSPSSTVTVRFAGITYDYEVNTGNDISPDGWGSFLGSYIGGIATLIALLFTIAYTNFESLGTHRSLYRKSATIIYYDFKFAIEVISPLLDAKTKKLPRKLDLNSRRRAFQQMYIDTNWIQTVAELNTCNRVKDEDMRAIFEIYGFLQNIVSWRDSISKVDSIKTVDVAFDSINKLDVLNDASNINKILNKLNDILSSDIITGKKKDKSNCKTTD